MKMTCKNCHETIYIYKVSNNDRKTDEQAVKLGGNKELKCPYCGESYKESEIESEIAK